MKKYFLSLLLVTFFSSVVLFAQFGGGGPGTTKYNAWEIWTIDNLMELHDSIINSTDPNFSTWHFGKHFRLMQDIPDSIRHTIGWVPFCGHFHGGGNKLILAMNSSNPFEASSLFGSLSRGGSIDSLIVDGYIIAEFNGIHFASGIVRTIGGAAWNNVHPASTITNSTSNLILGGMSGIAGTNNGIISNCVFNGSITGVDRIGGIAGENSGQIINCINNGKIVATNSGGNTIFSGVGGIVGTIANGGAGIVVSHNINNGIVEGQGFVGGIIGLAVSHPATPTVATHNINYGFIKGTNAVGGILGNAFIGPPNIFNNFNSGVVIGVSETGCIVGRNNGGTISNNHYDKQMCGE